MALDFPSSPIEGQVLRPGGGAPNYTYRGGTWSKNAGTALPYNRVVNPAMQISQQNNFNSGGGGLSGTYYITDQWNIRWSTTTSPTVQVMTWSTAGIRDIYVNVAAGVLSAAGDYILITQLIEGTRVADLQWGTANAKSIVLRFRHRTSQIGLYSVRVSNSASTRSFVATFNSSYSDKDEVISIPGDTTGAWLTDTGVGIRLDFCAAIGSTYHGVAGWQDGNKYAIPGQFSGYPGSYWQFYIANVGLYADPFNTGISPEFVAPNYEDDLEECQRYWYKQFVLRGPILDPTRGFGQGIHPTPMRVAPSMSIFGSPGMCDLSVIPAITSLTAHNVTQTQIYASATCAAGGFAVGRPAMQVVGNQEANAIAFSARL